MRTIIAGNNKLACDVLEWLIKNHKEDVVGIVAENRDMTKEDVGREKPLTETAGKISKEYKIPLYIGNISIFAAKIKALSPDIISPCRHKGLVKKSILDIPRIIDANTGTRCCTNLHYGALPRYGGMSPGFWAIRNGEKKIGVTFQYMENEFDTGPVLDQRFIDITEGRKVLRLPGRKIIVKGMTDFDIYQRCNELALQMYKENYPLIASGKARLKKQELSKRLYYTISQTDNAKREIIDIEKSSDEEISAYARSRYFPFFGFPKARYKGNKIELRLQEE